MIEYDGQTFRTSDDRDKFIKEREDRRKQNISQFQVYNDFNHGMATVGDVGVWACPDGGPRGRARLFAFNEPNAVFKMQESQIFKEAYPEFKWDTTQRKQPLKRIDDKDFKTMVDGLIVKLTSKQEEKSQFAGMGLSDMLKAIKEAG